MQKQVKPDLHEARDTPPCPYPAGACRISSSAPRRAGARFLPQTQQLASAARWALNLPRAQSPHSFPNIKGAARFILPSAKPVSSLHGGKSRRGQSSSQATRQSGKQAVTSHPCHADQERTILSSILLVGSGLGAVLLLRARAPQTPSEEHRRARPCRHHVGAPCAQSRREGTNGDRFPRDDASPRIRQQPGCISTSCHRSHFSPPDHGKAQTLAGEAPLCQSPTPQRCCGDAHPGTARPEPCPALNHIPLVRNTSGTLLLGQKPARGCSGHCTTRASPRFSWGTVAGSQLPGRCTGARTPAEYMVLSRSRNAFQASSSRKPQGSNSHCLMCVSTFNACSCTLYK